MIEAYFTEDLSLSITSASPLVYYDVASRAVKFWRLVEASMSVWIKGERRVITNRDPDSAFWMMVVPLTQEELQLVYQPEYDTAQAIDCEDGSPSGIRTHGLVLERDAS